MTGQRPDGRDPRPLTPVETFWLTVVVCGFALVFLVVVAKLGAGVP